MTILAVLLAALFFPAPPGFPAMTEASTAGAVSVGELAWGRWGLLFAVLPGCPACAEVIRWLGQSAQVLPELRFAVVVPEITVQLVAYVEAASPGVAVVLDRGGALGGTFGVKRAPTLILLVDGKPVGRLDWPFTEENVVRELTRSLGFASLTPRDLLGAPAPDFLALSLSGEPVVLADLSRPVLLVFFNPACPPCWDALPALAEISRHVAVGVLAFVGEPGLSPADRGRFEQFVQGVHGHPRFVFLVQDLEVLRAYRVMRMPSYILLDEKGVITWVWDGPMRGSDLVAAVRAALNKGD